MHIVEFDIMYVLLPKTAQDCELYDSLLYKSVGCNKLFLLLRVQLDDTYINSIHLSILMCLTSTIIASFSGCLLLESIQHVDSLFYCPACPFLVCNMHTGGLPRKPWSCSQQRGVDLKNNLH